METKQISIASALRQVKRIKGQIGAASEAMKASACYVQGKEPAFKFDELVITRAKLVKDMLNLESAVATANASGKLQNCTVVFAIRKLAEIKGEIKLWRDFTVRVTPTESEVTHESVWDDTLDKHTRREKTTVHISAVTQAKVAATIDALQLEFEELNAELESFNHRTLVSVSV